MYEIIAPQSPQPSQATIHTIDVVLHYDQQTNQ